MLQISIQRTQTVFRTITTLEIPTNGLRKKENITKGVRRENTHTESVRSQKIQSSPIMEISRQRLSFVLSCIRLYRMPTGGSVTPGSMLPLMLFSVAYGAGPGLLAGLVYGVLQYLQGGWWLNVWQFLLDYILAFTVLGLAGIAHNKGEKWMYLSIPFAALMRALCAFLAGLMWVADTPVSELVIGNWQFSTPVTYSLVYNGAYLIPDTLICLLLAALVGKRLLKAIKGN